MVRGGVGCGNCTEMEGNVIEGRLVIVARCGDGDRDSDGVGYGDSLGGVVSGNYAEEEA